MKLETKFLLIAIIAILLALPVALSAQHRTAELKIEKAQNKGLQLKLNSKQDLLKQQQIQTEQEKQKNLDLQKQLQTKRETAAKLAAAAVQRQKMLLSNCEGYRGLVSQYNWNISVAMAIMKAESNCRAITPSNAAINYDNVPDYGLFQLHGIAVTDPAENVRIAYQVKYLSQGWGAWSTYNSGVYLHYL